MKKKRFILLVVDGLGVGEMSDVKLGRPQDRGAHTLKNILLHNPGIRLPHLKQIGALDYFVYNTLQKRTKSTQDWSWGKCELAHYGADSFMGHQEISGTRPLKPLQQFMVDIKDTIIDHLHKKGMHARFVNGIVLTDKHIAISDNIESDYGFNLSLVGSLDDNTFEDILAVGQAVREVVQVGRVITMGGRNVSLTSLMSCIQHRTIKGKTVIGINVPNLNIYNEHYRVVHLGLAIDREKQAPHIAGKNGYPVVLIGKAADVITAENATYHPAVHTEDVLSHLYDAIETTPNGLIFANVQESDLAGHRQDVAEYSRHLELVDSAIPRILAQMHKEDVLIITGDHGNDPTIHHSFHTRELTPLMFFSQRYKGAELGIRATLADIGASICDFFALQPPEFGLSLLPVFAN